MQHQDTDKLNILLEKLHLNSVDFNSLFDEIADTLMNYYSVKTIKGNFRITELEFYIYAPGHEDIYTNIHDCNIGSGYWEFVAQIDEKELDKTRFKGIHINLGNGNEICGGILVCGLVKLGDPKLKSEGAKDTVELILNHINDDYKSFEVMNLMNGGIGFDKGLIELVQTDFKADKKECKRERRAISESVNSITQLQLKPLGNEPITDLEKMETKVNFYKDLLYKYVLSSN